MTTVARVECYRHENLATTREGCMYIGSRQKVADSERALPQDGEQLNKEGSIICLRELIDTFYTLIVSQLELLFYPTGKVGQI